MDAFVASIEEDLPKISLEATIDNLMIPAPLDELLGVEDPNTSAGLFAYSPKYNPMATDEGPIGEAKRRGGLAIRTKLRFGDYVTIDNAELGIFPGANFIPDMSGSFTVSQFALPIQGSPAFHDVMVDTAVADRAGNPLGAPFVSTFETN